MTRCIWNVRRDFDESKIRGRRWRTTGIPVIVMLLMPVMMMACGGEKYYECMPANPPIGMELKKDSNGNHVLIFHSANQFNPRFSANGGYMLFSGVTVESARDNKNPDFADYNDFTGPLFNGGVGVPVVILFKTPDTGDQNVIIDGNVLTVTARRPSENIIAVQGKYLTGRGFFIDTDNCDHDPATSIILGSPGNVVYIEP